MSLKSVDICVLKMFLIGMYGLFFFLGQVQLISELPKSEECLPCNSTLTCIICRDGQASSLRHGLGLTPYDAVRVQTRAVVLESGLETFFYRLGLVLDSLVFGLGLVSNSPSDSPNVQVGLDRVQQYMLFFLFQTKPLIRLACSANG